MTRGVTAAITFSAHSAQAWRGERQIDSNLGQNLRCSYPRSCNASCQDHKRHGCGTELREGFYVSKNQQSPEAAVGEVERRPFDAVCMSFHYIWNNIPLHPED